PGNANFSPFAPLQHALQCFKPVEIVTVYSAVANRQGFLYPGIVWHFHRRNSPGDGEARPRHKGKSHRSGRIVHALRPIPVPREMLVAKNRNRTPAIAEHLNCFLKEPIARILNLSLSSLRIVSVFAHDDYTVYSKLARPLRERFRNGRVNFHAREPAGSLAA